jgi:hypothetical protein
VGLEGKLGGRYLLHYRDGFMDVYEKSGVFGQRWQLWKEECEAVVLGRPCLVREVATGVLTTTAIAPSVDIPLEPQTILDVIREWKQKICALTEGSCLVYWLYT